MDGSNYKQEEGQLTSTLMYQRSVFALHETLQKYIQIMACQGTTNLICSWWKNTAPCLDLKHPHKETEIFWDV